MYTTTHNTYILVHYNTIVHDMYKYTIATLIATRPITLSLIAQERPTVHDLISERMRGDAMT